ncbi:MAG: hypothetical protein JRI25_05350 [Deltaproteobacteria bacterium]|nr:hypothetical protein [Deltaproteobacteria bacterium]
MAVEIGEGAAHSGYTSAMDRGEARAVLEAELERWREVSWATWRGWITERRVEVVEVVGPSGTAWQIEILAVWDATPEATIRVLASSDDGSLFGAFRPVCDDLLVEAPPPE